MIVLLIGCHHPSPPIIRQITPRMRQSGVSVSLERMVIHSVRMHIRTCPREKEPIGAQIICMRTNWLCTRASVCPGVKTRVCGFK